MLGKSRQNTRTSLVNSRNRTSTVTSAATTNRKRKQRPEEGRMRHKVKERHGINKHVGEDPTKMITEISPGKKGGDFNFSFGGQISVPGGILGKKDVITCCTVSPSDRFKYQPPLRSDEHLLSEIFLIALNYKTIKKGPSLALKLPYYLEKTALISSQLLFKPVDQEDWMVLDCEFDTENHLAHASIDVGGILVVSSVTRFERFDVLVQGCLYNARLHHQISVRFPKKTIDADMKCDISITPLNHSILDKLQGEYPYDMCELLVASDFYEIRPSEQKLFRRSVTVKLPLPAMPSEDFPQEDVAVMQKNDNENWILLDTPLKFVKNAITFETRNLARYCVCLAKHDRKKRLPEAFKHIERENGMVRGEILPFINIQEKCWTLWFDVIPWAKVGQTVEKRVEQGFRRVKKMQLPMMDIQKEEEKVSRKSAKFGRSGRQASPEKKPNRDDLDLVNGSSFDLEIEGDVKVRNDDTGGSNRELRFHDKLPQNYRRFFIEPLPMSRGRILTCFLKIYAKGPDGEKDCIRTFDFDVQPEAVGAYIAAEAAAEQEHEPEPEPEVIEPEPEPAKVDTPPPQTPPQPKPSGPKQNPASFARLTKSTKPAKKLFREPKVLTGRSLMSLAREVEQGLTLAIHLDISDSTITGMGFDALANGLNLVDITYKILLLWKRRTSRFKGKQVQMLISAMEEMGRKDLADVINDRDQANLEILPECFNQNSKEETL